MQATQCSIDGCDRPREKRQWCQLHYRRIRKFGSHKLPPKPTVSERFWARVEQCESGCWIWTGVLDSRQRYGRFAIKKRQYQAHRVAWYLHTGEWPPGDRVVCHSCDTPSCVNPAHLFLGTQADNLRDMWVKGRGHDGSGSARGEARYNAVLTDELVREIRAEYASGVPIHVLARRYDRDASHLRQVVRRQIWKHVI